MSACSSYEIALKINSVLSKIQAELKCGVCRSTFSRPVSATCGHVFCKDCLDQVFQYQRAVECPICRKKINKRSCTASEQHDAIVKGYLQIGRYFRSDLHEQSLCIPKDIAYAESQVPAALTVSNSPMRDFRPSPQFALPKSRGRRKRLCNARIDSKVPKMDPILEETDSKGDEPSTLEKAGETAKDLVSVKSSISACRSQQDVHYIGKKSVNVQCNLPDPACRCDLRKSLQFFREKSPSYRSDLLAIFELMPELKHLIAENIVALCDLFKLQPCTISKNHQTIDTVKRAHTSTEVTLDDLSSGEDRVVLEGQLNAPLKSVSSSDTSQKELPLLNELEKFNNFDSDNMDITIQVPFESCPEDVASHFSSEKENMPLHGPIVISVSRPNCIEDENLVHEFLLMFPKVVYSEEISYSSTHLIMMNSDETSCIRKSLRYLFAVACKCEVVVRSWLEDCIKSQRLLPTTKYGFSCEKAGEEPGWIRARRIGQPLFDRMSFFLPLLFADSLLLPREKLKQLITACGGACFDKPWDIVNSENAYTIFMPHSKDVNAARRYEASMHGVPVLLADWVLDSVAAYRTMPIDSYKICKR